MPRWSAELENRPVLDFVQYCLRGVGQIVFMNNPVTGLLILAAISAFSPWLGLAAVVGVVSSTAFALVLGLDRGTVRAGLYGFNGALVGVGLATFLAAAWSPLTATYIAVIAAFSTVLMAALGVAFANLGVPPLTLPFNLVTLAFLLAVFAVARGEVAPIIEPQGPAVGGGAVDTSLRVEQDGAGAGAIEGVANAVLRGIGQLFLSESAVTGLIVLAGMAVCSRIAAAVAVAGSALGMATGLLLGADGHEVYQGLWGFNSYVSAVALGGVFVVLTWRSAVVAAACAVAAALLFAATTTFLSPWGLPALTLPFCLATLAFLVIRDLTPKLQPVALGEISTPEEHRSSAPTGSRIGGEGSDGSR